MTNLTFIPDEITNDEELSSWFEEQAARVAHENNLAFSETLFDEEDMKQSDLISWSWG